MRFISGANLGFNLKDTDKIYPFYNPPGARGEDTFLSTCLGEHNIRKVPCYTFHDGFATYEHLLLGALPNRLKPMQAESKANSKRFFKACVGWVRYKPLLIYITHREDYAAQIEKMRQDITRVMPMICDYFGNDEYKTILKELDFYDQHVEEHYKDFDDTKAAWAKVMKFFKEHEKSVKSPSPSTRHSL